MDRKEEAGSSSVGSMLKPLFKTRLFFSCISLFSPHFFFGCLGVGRGWLFSALKFCYWCGNEILVGV